MTGEAVAGLLLFIAVISGLLLLVELLHREPDDDETGTHQAMRDALDPARRRDGWRW